MPWEPCITEDGCCLHCPARNNFTHLTITEDGSGLHCHALNPTLIAAAADPEISVNPPCRTPAVLDDPVAVRGWGFGLPPAHNEHSVVCKLKRFKRVALKQVMIDSRFVLDKVVIDHEANSNRAAVVDGIHHFHFIAAERMCEEDKNSQQVSKSELKKRYLLSVDATFCSAVSFGKIVFFFILICLNLSLSLSLGQLFVSEIFTQRPLTFMLWNKSNF